MTKDYPITTKAGKRQFIKQLSKHTQEPWEAEPMGHFARIWSRKAATGLKLIAEVITGNDEDKANMRLIAAAPNLLKTCQALHDALSNILEGCASPERGQAGFNDHPGYDYPWIHRDQRALALRALRQSQKTVAKAQGK
jgi:hypothetical protein